MFSVWLIKICLGCVVYDLLVLGFAVLSLVGLLVPCLLCFCHMAHGSGTVDVHLIPTPRDDEVDHMPVFGTRMHPCGLAFMLLLGVRYHQFELRTQSQ